MGLIVKSVPWLGLPRAVSCFRVYSDRKKWEVFCLHFSKLQSTSFWDIETFCKFLPLSHHFRYWAKQRCQDFSIIGYCFFSSTINALLHGDYIDPNWLNPKTLHQRSPNFFVRGTRKLLRNSSRAGHLTQCDNLGYVSFYHIHKFFVNTVVFYYWQNDSASRILRTCSTAKIM